jgi:hypothetical protein
MSAFLRPRSRCELHSNRRSDLQSKRRQHPPRPKARSQTFDSHGSLDGVAAYAQGVLYSDRSIYVDEVIQDVVRRLSLKEEKARVPWRDEGCSVGGFPAHVTRAASPKGARVVLGAAVPREMPAELEQFLDEHRVDTRYLRLIDDGRMPQTLRLRFADGNQLLIVDKGDGTYGLPVPEARFDVVLVNPGEAATRRSILNELRERNNGETVGLIARGDWTEHDWRFIEGTGFRVYLNRTELN